MPALQASHDLSRVAIESGMHYITHVYNNNKVYKKVNLRLCAECGVLVGRIYGLSVENWCSSRDGYVCERPPNTVLQVTVHTIPTQSVTQNGGSRVNCMQVVDV